MIDLEPATTRLSELIRAVADEQLHNKTPCADMAVGELVDHVQTRSVAFAAAARKDPTGPSGPPPPRDASNLPTDWREHILRALDTLASAWKNPRPGPG